jgi:hypothetical protein
MDGSKGHPKTRAGLDLGDNYCYLCLIDSQSGEVIEEGRLRTSPEAFLRLTWGQERKQTGGGGRGKNALCAFARFVGERRSIRAAAKHPPLRRSGGLMEKGSPSIVKPKKNRR